MIATRGRNGSAAPPTGPSDKEPTVGGLALFEQWPGKGQQKPDAAIILTGQTFGLLQPCGCSRPQKGGLERRAQFINTLKAKGWPVAGVDLGDLYPDKSSFRDQGLLRYETTMHALREMGYLAVGVGKTEFEVEVDRVIGEYALQTQQPPFLLAANLLGVVNGNPVARNVRFPPVPNARRPLINDVEVEAIGTVTIGVVGIVGRSLAEDVEKRKLDPSITFVKQGGQVNNAAVLANAVKALAAHPKKPQLNVLLYQGSNDEARKVAEAFPQFHVILCQAEDPEPPQKPTIVGKTLIIDGGHKGRYVGVLGAFKKNGGELDLHYQVVPLEEFYITPGNEGAARKAHAILPILDKYSEQVRDRAFLKAVPRGPHRAQVIDPKLTYVGSEACKACHAAEHAHWDKQTGHGHALDTLETVATRPSLRNYDPECVVCHTVGFKYQSGYEDDKKTPHLKHVGCENCHGPGSGHVANPKAANFLALMSEWKAKPGDKLPQELLKKLAEVKAIDRGKIAIKPEQQVMINAVARMCAQCHDPDNDPNFDFPTYWPKVNHSGMAPPGGWPAVPPKNAAPANPPAKREP